MRLCFYPSIYQSVYTNETFVKLHRQQVAQFSATFMGHFSSTGEKARNSWKSNLTCFWSLFLQNICVFSCCDRVSLKSWCMSCLSLQYLCQTPRLTTNSMNFWKGNVWQSGRRNSTLPANVYWVCPTCCMMGRNRVHHEVLSENNNNRKTCTCMSNYIHTMKNAWSSF